MFANVCCVYYLEISHKLYQRQTDNRTILLRTDISVDYFPNFIRNIPQNYPPLQLTPPFKDNTFLQAVGMVRHNILTSKLPPRPKNNRKPTLISLLNSIPTSILLLHPKISWNHLVQTWGHRTYSKYLMSITHIYILITSMYFSICFFKKRQPYQIRYYSAKNTTVYVVPIDWQIVINYLLSWSTSIVQPQFVRPSFAYLNIAVKYASNK